MNLEIRLAQDDDPDFIHGLTYLVCETIRQYDPSEVFLVRTDNWFDVKWFAFAGQARVGIDKRVDGIDSEDQPFWKSRDDVTIPPFVPRRIIEQTHMHYADGSLTSAGDNARLVHRPEKKQSSHNLSNRLLDHSPSALFIWFSSKSNSNGRASMMVHRTHEQKVGGWYVSFIRDQTWQVDRVRNRKRDLIDRLFQPQAKDATTRHPDEGATGDSAPGGIP